MAWFIETWAYCAADCFAMISGYVGYREKRQGFNPKSLIFLWIRVVFISLLMCGIFAIIAPSTVTLKVILQSIFPISFSTYWYFTAYFGVALFAPVINSVVRSFNNSRLKRFLVAIVLLFSFYACFVSSVRHGTDPFTLNSGYSFLWLVIMYFVGASIKKCSIGTEISTRKNIGILLCCQAITWCYVICVSMLTMKLLGSVKGTGLLACYISPTVLVMGIVYINLFAKITMTPRSEKAIKLIAPGAFSAYIVNDGPLFRKYFMEGHFKYLAHSSPVLIPVVTILFAFVFVIVISLLDKLREKLFSIVKTNVLEDKIEKGIEYCFDRLIRLMKHVITMSSR